MIYRLSPSDLMLLTYCFTYKYFRCVKLAEALREVYTCFNNGWPSNIQDLKRWARKE